MKRLMEEQLVTDKETGELRRVRYSDIVILLRSLSGWADAFAGVLNEAGIGLHRSCNRIFFGGRGTDRGGLVCYGFWINPDRIFRLLRSFGSPIVGMTDEELARLRLTDKEASFHDCVLQRCVLLAEGAEAKEHAAEQEQPQEQPFEQKLHRFYTMYQRLRKLVPDTPIHELIEILLKETGYGNYAAAMPAGRRRRANLQMLVEKAIAYENTSYKGLFHFVRYIDELQKYDVDFGEADLTGEQDDVVRIMSIHKRKGLEFPVALCARAWEKFQSSGRQKPHGASPGVWHGLRPDGWKAARKDADDRKAGNRKADRSGESREELRVIYRRSQERRRN